MVGDASRFRSRRTVGGVCHGGFRGTSSKTKTPRRHGLNPGGRLPTTAEATDNERRISRHEDEAKLSSGPAKFLTSRVSVLAAVVGRRDLEGEAAAAGSSPIRVCCAVRPPLAAWHTLSEGVTAVGLRSRSAVYDALSAALPGFPGYRDDQPLDLPPLTERDEQELRDLIADRGFDPFSEALAKVGNCAHPVRLVGSSQRVDTRTGEILSTYSSAEEPLGATFVRCGNRRESECPSCSRLHAGDMFHLIRAGIAGGKTVPETVAENPLVFATFTAPSFGHVHGRRDSGPCRSAAPGARCRHGRRLGCPARHTEDDAILGQPLCGECYDYASHVVWQWWAPALWRRFTIALNRLVAKQQGIPAGRLGEVATVQYAKVGENQLRGVIHFHGLIRLDGPKTDEGFAPAPVDLEAGALAALVRRAAARVRLRVPGVDAQDPDRVLAFGQQLDARPVRNSRRTDDPDRQLIPDQVAGYLAKYATKSVGDTSVSADRHYARIRATVGALANRARAAAPDNATDAQAPYRLLGKWAHMLGFRGHFATKSRRYAITLGQLRRARRRAQQLIAQHRANGTPLDLASLEADLLAEDDDETTLVIGHWTYAGTGWATEAQTMLANAAAARAREYDQWGANERRKQWKRTKEGNDHEKAS